MLRMPVSANWTARPGEPLLTETDIHLWRASLDCNQAILQRWEATLAEDELARASRFIFPLDRNRFIAARGILRAIFSQYLQRPAAAVEFMYGPEGKPRLRVRDAVCPIRFNLSHSQGLAVFAFSCNREIGVDVEAIRANVTAEEIAERFFSSNELAEFRALPPEQRAEGFFACWTRKEAYVKARGSGLAIPLDSFDVSLTPGTPEGLVSVDSDRWMLNSFRPADGYAGALVAEGNDLRLHFWDWALRANE
jgi:4'-phosphopantetheinyl transferase